MRESHAKTLEKILQTLWATPSAGQAILGCGSLALASSIKGSARAREGARGAERWQVLRRELGHLREVGQRRHVHLVVVVLKDNV